MKYLIIIFLLIFPIGISAANYNDDDFHDLISYIIYPNLGLRETANWAKEIARKDTQAVSVLIDYLSSVNSRTLWEVKYVLIDIGKYAVPQISDRLSDTLTTANILSIEILGEIGDSSIINKLYPLLNSEYSQVRNYTAIALGKLKDKNAIKKLLPLTRDSFDMPRKSALVSIGRLADNDTNTLNIVYNNTKDTYFFQRFSAIEAIQKFDTDIVLPMMFEKLKEYSMLPTDELNIILRIISTFKINNEFYVNIIKNIFDNSNNEVSCGYAMKILNNSSALNNASLYQEIFIKKFPTLGAFNIK